MQRTVLECDCAGKTHLTISLCNGDFFIEFHFEYALVLMCSISFCFALNLVRFIPDGTKRAVV